MRKWRFRKDLMPGGASRHKEKFKTLDDPLAKDYPSKTIRFGSMTQVLCGAFVSLFGLGMYPFGVKGWLTEWFVHLTLIGGLVFILTGIWGSETAKFTSRWKIIVYIVFTISSAVIGLVLVVSACSAIPIEYKALDHGWIREVTHMRARVVLAILIIISDVICLIASVSQLRIAFRATVKCCKQLEVESPAML